jgi:hypothetical protein
MVKEIFEGAKSVRIWKGNRETFDRIKKKLGLSNDIDLVTLCASIAFHKYKSIDNLENMPSRKKLADMGVFEDRELFDYFIISCYGCEQNRLKVFESFFYTGYGIIKEWFETNAPLLINELEAYVDLVKYVIE